MVAFTISLLNRSTRNQPHAWRRLGSIPNFHSVNHKSVDEKVIDDHLIMCKLLQDLHTVQSTTPGVLWPLMYNKKFFMIRLKPYILCVLGDTPGLNAQAGKFKEPSAGKLCRYCDFSKKKLFNPWYTGRLVTQEDVMQWQNNPHLHQEIATDRLITPGITCVLVVAIMAYTVVCLQRLCMPSNRALYHG